MADTKTPAPAAVEIADADELATEVPEGAVAIRFPVIGVEGMDTSDGRHIAPQALTTRPLPIPLYAQTRSTHGADGDAATWHVGAITHAVRRAGSEVTQLSTGQPFPDGVFVWEGRGWIYTDVPAAPQKSAYQLVRDGALRGISMDLSAVDAEVEYPEGSDQPERIVMHAGSIAAATLVGQPAFQDAYVEVDGEIMAPEAVTAGGVPSWRSADLGDDCSPCLAGDAITADAAELEHVAELAQGDDFEPAEPERTDGMIALIPENPAMLTVPGGDPAEQLHLTVAYLGDQVDRWDQVTVDALHEAMTRVALGRGGDLPVDGPEDVVHEAPGPVVGKVFAHAVFNPNGDNGFDPATVYLLSTVDEDGRDFLGAVAQDAKWKARDVLGDAHWPQQHEPWVPHVTAGYGVDPGQLTYTGPVVFDRLRVALGGEFRDYPLGGGAVVASGALDLPPAHWFADPGLTEPTPLTVLENGQTFGHIALWSACHIGYSGKCVTPPRSKSGYAYYLVHSTQARDHDRGGVPVTIPVGYGTVGTGHADLRSNALAAAEHYDNTGTAAFEWTCGEDAHGIWVAGRLLPDLDPATELRARGTVMSGDWRTIRGGLEMVAALGVNVPGFPVPRARVASGLEMPVAMVAAGAPALRTVEAIDTAEGSGRGALAAELVAAGLPASVRRVIDYVDGIRLREEHAGLTAELDGALDGVDEELALAHAYAEAELTFALEGWHPWFEDPLADDDAEALAGKLSLPPYIKRIAKHLEAEGMDKGHAIAAAKNAAEKMCKTGDLNFPGKQKVNAGSQAEACKAVAQWKADRPGAK